ncbi:gamma-glutamyltransferase [Streptomyces sp. M19]
MRLGGTPGGDGQSQWNTQVAAALLFDGNRRCALSMPRWTYFPGGDKAEAGLREQLHTDDTLDPAIAAELTRRGHDVVLKASVGGVNRLLERDGERLHGLDDGRQEGLTAGR